MIKIDRKTMWILVSCNFINYYSWQIHKMMKSSFKSISWMSY